MNRASSLSRVVSHAVAALRLLHPADTPGPTFDPRPAELHPPSARHRLTCAPPNCRLKEEPREEEEKEVKEHQEVEEVGMSCSGEASMCHKVLNWFSKLGIAS